MSIAVAAGASASVAVLDKRDKEMQAPKFYIPEPEQKEGFVICDSCRKCQVAIIDGNQNGYICKNCKNSNKTVGQEKLFSIRRKFAIKQRQFKLQLIESERDWNDIKSEFKRKCLPNMTTNKVAAIYSLWLESYIESGGEPTHCYDYNTPNNFYVATHDFHLITLYGSASVSVVVSKGIKVTFDNLGHNQVYEFDGLKLHGFSVPVYNDTEF